MIGYLKKTFNSNRHNKKEFDDSQDVRHGESIKSKSSNSDDMCFSESAAAGPPLEQNRDARSNHSSSQIKSGGPGSLTGGQSFGKPRLSLNLGKVIEPITSSHVVANKGSLSNRSKRGDL